MFIEEINTENENVNSDSILENHNKDYKYNINNCVLVRTTNYLPNNGVVETPSNACAVSREFPSGFKYILMDLLEGLTPEEKKNTLEYFKVCERVKRQTLHFCVNGLVSSHQYGSFDNRPIKIIEPLKYHINRENMLGLRAEDTYFNENVNLSNEAVLLIQSDYYNLIKDDPRYIDELGRYRLFTYTGENEVYAVNTVLNKLGYDALLINEHGYLNGLDSETASNKMYNFLSGFAKTNSISQERHFYSDIRAEDLESQEQEDIRVTLKIIDRMISDLGKNDEYKQYMHEIYETGSYTAKYNEQYISDLISEYGLEHLAYVTGLVNDEILQEINEERVQKHI